jgi:hypothetical protein
MTFYWKRNTIQNPFLGPQEQLRACNHNSGPSS